MFFDSIGIGFEKFWYRLKYWYRFRFFLVSKKVSVSVSKKFGIEKSIGIGIGKILVSKKVSVLVSEKNWYRKKYRYRYQKKLVSQKSFRFCFVQIFGFVTLTIRDILCWYSSNFLNTIKAIWDLSLLNLEWLDVPAWPLSPLPVHPGSGSNKAKNYQSLTGRP